MEKKKLKRLLGPLKKVHENELRIYQLALLYKHVPLTETTQGLNKGNVDKENEHCAGPHSEFHTASTNDVTNNMHNAENDKIFVPLECTRKSLIQLQTYNMWKAVLDMGWKIGRARKRTRIALQPLDNFPEFLNQFMFKGKEIRFFEFLQDFTRVYFLGFDIDLLEAIDMQKANWKITSRINQTTGEKQYLTKDIQMCLKNNIPARTYCTIGISWTDLYAKADENFVLGEATSILNSGILSFGRFEPKLFKNGNVPPPINQLDANLIWRMIKVLSHEVCHIFGLAHCFYFECNMNESRSVKEAMSQPLYLCPVCLRKLQKICRFNLEEYYTLLLQFLFDISSEYRDCDKVEETIHWLERCLKFMV